MRFATGMPRTALLSALAALTTWLTLSTWSGFSDRPGDYLRPLAVGCALVAITGTALRATRLHPLGVLGGQLAVVAVWLNHRLAPESSVLGWLPTAESFRTSLDSLAASVDAAQSYAAPVPESVTTLPPILIVLGISLAVVVDFVACGLRFVPLAGLPLLAMYTAPVSILEDGVTWWQFGLVAVAFLAMLAADEASRLALWGRDLSAPDSEHASRAGRSVWPSARKIGVTATALAAVVPVFVPTLSGGLLSGGGVGNGDGTGGVNISNPMLNLKRDLERGADVPLIRVTTSDPAPRYLRVAVLDSYTAERWVPSKRDIPVENRVEDGLPRPIGLRAEIAATEQRYLFTADDDFDSSWLPTPYPPIDIDGQD